MIRSGRIRSALRTSRRIVTSPRPSRFGGRASSRTTCGWRSRSSAASSIVTTRSPSPTNVDSAFSVVVLPEPVPPQTRIVARARTARARKSSSGRVSVPFATRSSAENPCRRKRRIVSAGPSSASGGSTTLIREPSGSRASHERLGLVGPPAQRRQDPLDRVAQVGLALEAHAGRLQPPAPLDPHRRGAGDHDLVHRRVGQQRLQRPEPERPLRDPRDELRAAVLAQHARLAVDQRADAARADRRSSSPAPASSRSRRSVASVSSGSMYLHRPAPADSRPCQHRAP